MHIPDGFIGGTTSLGAGALTAAGLGACARRTRDVLADAQVPLAGLTAAFIFAAQMLNFPVANGTSGHLLGGALAAILMGPATGALCLAVVLFVQALFADGGLTALGLNILNMSLVAAFGGYGVFRGARFLLARSRRGVVLASAVAAFASVVLASVAFTAEYALGGAVDLSLAKVLTAMVGAHVLIGVGEAVITALTVSAVLATRPDLVQGARDLLPVPVLVGAST